MHIYIPLLLPLLRINPLSHRDKKLCEIQEIQRAHNIQFENFNKAWDSYLEEYDTMSQGYVKQLMERYGYQAWPWRYTFARLESFPVIVVLSHSL